MSEYSEKQAKAKSAENDRNKELKRLASLASEVFTTQAGDELLSHLSARFGLINRTFIPDATSGDVCPLRAAVRDGERSAITYLIYLIRLDKPDYPIPL